MSKIAIVTGASSGIGKVTALQLQKDGYIVYGVARRMEKMNDIKSKGIKTIQLDLIDDNSMVNCINSILETEGRIDVLVNNAGYGNYGSVEETPVEIARAQYEVNVFGLARMCQLVIPHMRMQKSGKIINISSVGGKVTPPFGGWYASTKHALESLSDAMRMELKQFGIEVIIIEPGVTKTEFSSHAYSSILEISGNGAYKKTAVKAKKALESNGEKASPATVISETISKAIKANKPKSRYVCGYRAGITLTVKKLLSDKAFDKMLVKELMDNDV